MLGVVLISAGGEVLGSTETAQRLLGGAAVSRLEDVALCGETHGTAESIRWTIRQAIDTGEAASTEVRLHTHPVQPLVMSVVPLAAGGARAAVVVFRPCTIEPDDADAEATQLLAEVAHELSRPIAAVLNYAEMALLDSDLSEPSRARIRMVVEQAKLCRNAIRHSLAMGRFTRPFLDDIDLNEIVGKAAERVRGPVGDAAALQTSLADELPPISGDPEDLVSVVRNLIENALHATAGMGESGRVLVLTEATPAGVRMTVTDNGPGIDPEVAGKLFEPFVTTKAPGHGAGLGLSIVRRIVRDHDGQIRADNDPGGGARFTVDLPTSVLPLIPPQHESASRSAGSQQPRASLVIDDDASMRRLLRSYLEGFGYEVDEAGDGAQALRLALGRYYDIIICDIRMPIMDGMEFFVALRERHPERAARVIMSTGVLPTDAADRFLRSLTNPRLQKPFKLTALRAAIEALDPVEAHRLAR
jgi:signal transduction histidine kinase/CheY-like chemotaxis protein